MKNENTDEKLRRLLALKKHEIPPPGFHDQLSSRIMDQIRREEQEVGFAPAIRRFFQQFELTPATLGMAGAAACAILLVALNQNPPQGAPVPAPAPSVATTTEIGTTLGELPMLAESPLLATNNTHTSAPSFLFDTPSLQTERASFKGE